MPERARQDQKQRLDDTMERLKEGVSEIFESGRYQEYLSVMSRFHRYSINNTILIALQKPDATHVAGYSAWRDKFGRQVRKGERGIDIIAPVTRKIRRAPDEDEREEPDAPGGTAAKSGREPEGVRDDVKLITTFKVAKVFDVSQTEGKELPTLGVDELVGDVERFDDVMEAIAQTAPCPIRFEDIPGGAKGYFSFAEGDKHIAIQKGMSEAQTVKTALHETCHARIHDVTEMADPTQRPDQPTREVQAESVAFVVAEHYGLDTGDYSFGYVAGWSDGRETTELKASLQTIRDTAGGIIDDVDRNLERIEQEREASISEAAFFVPEKGYLEVHRNAENMWDYTLYATDFQEIDGGVIESDAPIPQAVDDACALQDLDFDALQPVDAGSLNDKVDQCRSSAYSRSMAKASPKDVSLVERSSMRLRRPQRHEDGHEGRHSRERDGQHHGDAQRKPRHAKPQEMER